MSTALSHALSLLSSSLSLSLSLLSLSLLQEEVFHVRIFPCGVVIATWNAALSGGRILPTIRLVANSNPMGYNGSLSLIV